MPRTLLTHRPNPCPPLLPPAGGRTAPVTGPAQCILAPHDFYADAMAAHELLALAQSLASALDQLLPLARLAIPISGHPAVYDAEQALKAAEPWVKP